MALPTDPDERLALGRQLHERGPNLTVPQAAQQLGLREHDAYPVMKEYRDSVGIVTPSQIRIAKLRAEGRGPERAAANKKKANGGSHAPRQLPQADDPSVARIRDLEGQLAAALDEVDVLQKLLMIVGRSL